MVKWNGSTHRFPTNRTMLLDKNTPCLNFLCFLATSVMFLTVLLRTENVISGKEGFYSFGCGHTCSICKTSVQNLPGVPSLAFETEEIAPRSSRWFEKHQNASDRSTGDRNTATKTQATKTQWADSQMINFNKYLCYFYHLEYTKINPNYVYLESCHLFYIELTEIFAKCLFWTLS